MNELLLNWFQNEASVFVCCIMYLVRHIILPINIANTC